MEMNYTVLILVTIPCFTIHERIQPIRPIGLLRVETEEAFAHTIGVDKGC